MTPVSGGTRTRKRSRRFGGGESIGGYQLGATLERRTGPYQAYEAIEETSGWRAVLKIVEPPAGLDRDALEELAGGLRKQARIRQPNVVSLLDAGTDGKRLWVATEQVPNVTLAVTPRVTACRRTRIVPAAEPRHVPDPRLARRP
jgi:serine/threonine protein kinase